MRLPAHGGLYAWEFEKDGRELKVRVEGQLIFNTTVQMLNAALAGLGLAYVPEGMAQPDLARGLLKRVLEDWCLPYPGYHLWYPSRRQSSAAFALLVEALRYRGPGSTDDGKQGVASDMATASIGRDHPPAGSPGVARTRRSR